MKQGMSYPRGQLHRAELDRGLVARGLSRTSAQLHKFKLCGGSVTQGFSYDLGQMQGDQLHKVSVAMESMFDPHLNTLFLLDIYVLPKIRCLKL